MVFFSLAKRAEKGWERSSLGNGWGGSIPGSSLLCRKSTNWTAICLYHLASLPELVNGIHIAEFSLGRVKERFGGLPPFVFSGKSGRREQSNL